MPKLEPKMIQREVEQGLLWPIYWIYGPEKMKARELFKRIRSATLGSEEGGSGLFGLSEEHLEGPEAGSRAILEAAQCPAFGGGPRLIVVRDAHQIKEPEVLEALKGPRGKREELVSVCVFLSKDLDSRKKFSKWLIENAAVVPCEAVPEEERAGWIQYLAKRRELSLTPAQIAMLEILDPWNLEILDLELEKIELEGAGAGSGAMTDSSSPEVFFKRPDEFIQAFFERDLRASLQCVSSFADQPEEALPLLGLLAWNLRQLALYMGGEKGGAAGGYGKQRGYLDAKLGRWSRKWKLDELIKAQEEVSALDFSFKQTPLLPLGLWTALVIRFCREVEPTGAGP